MRESLVLAIEPDQRQAAILKRVVHDKRLAHVTVVDSRDAAVDAMRTSMPDVLLLSALLSPRDEDELIGHLRTLEHAGHVQVHTIPQLASTLSAAEEKASRGLLSAFRRKKTAETVVAGCDPELFAEEIRVFLQHASEKKQALESGVRITPDIRSDATSRTQSTAVEQDPADVAPASAWSSPFEWKPSGSDRWSAAPAAPSFTREPVAADPIVAPPSPIEPVAADFAMDFAAPAMPAVEEPVAAVIAPIADPIAEPIEPPAAAEAVVPEPVAPLELTPAIDTQALDVPAIDAAPVAAIEPAIEESPVPEPPVALSLVVDSPAEIELLDLPGVELPAFEHVVEDAPVETLAAETGVAHEPDTVVIDLDAPVAPVRAAKPKRGRKAAAPKPAAEMPVESPTFDRSEWTRDVQPSNGRADRLGPLARWARTEARKTKDTPVNADDVRALIASLSVPESVASVSYARGCRIRRVRVAPAGDAETPDSMGAVILSRRVLAEQRERRPSTT